jgi:hypothetical protein
LAAWGNAFTALVELTGRDRLIGMIATDRCRSLSYSPEYSVDLPYVARQRQALASGATVAGSVQFKAPGGMR